MTWMRRKIWTAIFIGILGSAFFTMPAQAHEVESSAETRSSQHRAVDAWCSQEWFDAHKAGVYGGRVEILGPGKFPIGPLPPRWVCHWKAARAPGASVSYEYYWTKRNGEEPFRLVESHYDPQSGAVFAVTYTESWIEKNKKGRAVRRCAFSSQSNKTVCRKLKRR